LIKTAIGSKLVAFTFAIYAFASGSIPADLVGEWKIGRPYDTPGPVGFDADQEKRILGERIRFSQGMLLICGKHIPIKAVELKELSLDAFLQTYGFIPKVIGIKDSTVTEVTINPSDTITACGNSEGSIGSNLFIGKDGHVVMEVANAYFLLIKRKK